MNVSSELSVVMIVGIEFFAFIGFLAASVADQETRKGFLAPILSIISFIGGLIAVFILPPDMFKTAVLVFGLFANIGSATYWFYVNRFKASSKGEARATQLENGSTANTQFIQEHSSIPLGAR